MSPVDFLGILLAGALALSVPVIVAGVGEIFLERTGGFNVGIEGMMLIGAVSGVIGANIGGFWLGLLTGVIAGVALGAILGVATAVGKADIVIVGIAIGLVGVGLSTFLYQVLAPQGQTNISVETQPRVELPFLDGVPVVGEVLGDAGILVYLAVAVTIAAWWVLRYTRFGLRLRAVGDAEKVAATRGIPIVATRVIACIIAGGLAGLAGAAVPLADVGSFSPAMTGGAGFIALAVVIIARKKPFGLLAGALLFGFFNSLALLAQTQNLGLPVELFQALPYIVTVAVLCLASSRGIRARIAA